MEKTGYIENITLKKQSVSCTELPKIAINLHGSKEKQAN